MKVYTCDTFEGHWPVGTCALVVEESYESARKLLDYTLRTDHNLPGLADDDELFEVGLGAPKVLVLRDGDY